MVRRYHDYRRGWFSPKGASDDVQAKKANHYNGLKSTFNRYIKRIQDHKQKMETNVGESCCLDAKDTRLNDKGESHRIY